MDQKHIYKIHKLFFIRSQSDDKQLKAISIPLEIVINTKNGVI